MPPAANYGDARAQAGAANAYAKSQRPWYKKKRWIGAIIVVAIIAIAAGTSGGGGSDKKKAADAPVTNAQKGDGTSSSSTPSPSSTPTKKAAPKPDNSSKGKGAITWGNWEVVGRLQVSKDALDDFDVVTRVRNTKDSSDTGIFTVTILKGNEILGTATCTTPKVPSGAIATATCESTDDYRSGYTEVTIEDAF
jgi:hypothetical protein